MIYEGKFNKRFSFLQLNVSQFLIYGINKLYVIALDAIIYSTVLDEKNDDFSILM
ncbi:hypothetical protein RhiirB3_461033 [Rhizophagus irregularis]|nr:hypothetical protein RhiirB3_461033 [Rhizophagus irregularis]